MGHKDKKLPNPVLSEKDVKEYWKRQINEKNQNRELTSAEKFPENIKKEKHHGR